MLFCMLYYESSNMDSQGNNNTDSFEILICAWCCLPKTYQTLLQNLLSFLMCWTIWHHLYNFRKRKKTQSSTKVTKCNTPTCFFSSFINCANGIKSCNVPHLFSLPELEKTPASTAVVTFKKKKQITL